MRYLTLAEVLEIHAGVLAIGGDGTGLRDLGALESAIAQPKMTFSGIELYGTIIEKAAALGSSYTKTFMAEYGCRGSSPHPAAPSMRSPESRRAGLYPIEGAPYTRSWHDHASNDCASLEVRMLTAFSALVCSKGRYYLRANQAFSTRLSHNANTSSPKS